MGRRAPLSPKHPAERVYWKNGAFHYVDKENKWHRLGPKWNREAKEKWAAVSSGRAAESTVGAMLDRHLARLRTRVASGDYSQETLRTNEMEADMLKRVFGHMKPEEVTRKHIAAYLLKRANPHTKKPAPIRANREIALLSAAYSAEIRALTLEDNPCIGVPRNKEKPSDRYVEHWERRQFAKRCCPDWLRAYLLLKYLTGLRMGNMLRLSSANETKRGLVVPLIKRRGGKRKVLEFKWTWALRTTVGFIHRMGSAQIRNTQPLLFFRGKSGEQLNASAFKSQWYRSMKKWKAMGNVPFTERDIRAKSGSDDPTLEGARERLGHDNSRTTSHHYRRGPIRVKPLR